MQMNEAVIYESYYFSEPNECLLTRVVAAENKYNSNVGDYMILGSTPKVYFNPTNVYAYDIQIQKDIGLFPLNWFEIHGVFDSIDELVKMVRVNILLHVDDTHVIPLGDFPDRVEESSVVSNVEISDNGAIINELKDSPPVRLIDVGAACNMKNNLECFG